MIWTIGQNVPWNASWTGEDRYEVRNCRWAGGKPAMWMPHAPGVGRPIFAKPHMVRQRRSIAERRCTVCGEKTTVSDQMWFPRGSWTPEGLWMSTEAPAHRNCAAIAMQLCPRLRADGDRPIRFPEPDFVVAAIVGGPETERDFDCRLNGRKVIGHLKFAWRKPPRCWACPGESTRND